MSTPLAQLPAEAAYAAVLPEMAALAEQEVMVPNIDVVGAVTTALGVLPSRRRAESASGAESSADEPRAAAGTPRPQDDAGAPEIAIDNSAGLPITRPFTIN